MVNGNIFRPGLESKLPASGTRAKTVRTFAEIKRDDGITFDESAFA